MHASIGHDNYRGHEVTKDDCKKLILSGLVFALDSLMVRALARKAEDPSSSPSPG